jgi:hypothetical protein
LRDDDAHRVWDEIDQTTASASENASAHGDCANCTSWIDLDAHGATTAAPLYRIVEHSRGVVTRADRQIAVMAPTTCARAF